MYTPNKFEIMGQKIEIFYTDELLLQRSAWGLYNHPQQKIFIQTKDHHGNELSLDFMTGILYHEITHAIFDILGYSDLSENEDLVDRVGHIIKQIMETLE